MWSNQVMTPVISPLGMMTRLEIDVDQSGIDTCLMCHVCESKNLNLRIKEPVCVLAIGESVPTVSPQQI
jgi:hypothetical protein